jgi:hypothetical protein
MVWTDVVRAVLHGLLAVLILAGHVPIWAVATIEAAFGAAEAFFRPAYTGLVPQTVPDELISEAQAVGFLTYNASGFIGPALGSALFLALGAGEAFAIDAATFVVSAVLLVRIRPRDRGERAERAPMLSELRGGWTELRARPWALLVIASACWALLVSMAPFQALGPAIGDEVYDQAAVFGLVSAFSGAGSIAGSILAVRWRPQRIIFVAMLVTMPWTGGYLAYALGAPLPLLGVIAFVGGFGIGLFMIWWESTLAREIPPAALSRVSAFDWMGSLGLLPLGLLIAGPLGATVGLRETLIAGCVLTLVVDVLFAGTRAIREFRPARALERT